MNLEHHQTIKWPFYRANKLKFFLYILLSSHQWYRKRMGGRWIQAFHDGAWLLITDDNFQPTEFVASENYPTKLNEIAGGNE